MARAVQLEFTTRTWGGRRAGAGRKPLPGRRTVAHRRRAAHDRRCPAHVTLRARAGLPSLRRVDLFSTMRAAFAHASSRRFRLLQFSVQADHVHLLVEGDGTDAFRRGIQGLAIRLAKGINRALRRRGRVWGDRYHARDLATPLEMRHALVYVLQNWRKHMAGARGMDPHSSAAWFAGWRTPTQGAAGKPPVVAAATWLARVGWRRHGVIGVDELPRQRCRCARRIV